MQISCATAQAYNNAACFCIATEDGYRFEIYKVEGLFYLFSRNKDTDQLCSYRESDLCLCFHIGMTRLIYLCHFILS